MKWPVLWYIDPGTGFTISGIGGWLAGLVFALAGMMIFFLRKSLGFLKKNRRNPLMAIGLTILLFLAIKGVSMIMAGGNTKARTVILGFDALSPEIMEPMMAEGALPNFSRLRNMGAYSRISTTNPSQSPVAWAGFATGQNPGKNGIFDFISRNPDNYRLDLALSKMVKGFPARVVRSKTFWQYASKKNVPSVILACPLTYPADRIRGRMLSGMGVPDILGTEGTFTFFTSAVEHQSEDTGGKVFRISRDRVTEMFFIGPRVAAAGGKAENIRVPFKVSLKGKDRVRIDYQKTGLELKTGEWSSWCAVEFKSGVFGRVKGIFKFYLVSVEPELELYVSPINFDPREPLFAISYPPGYSRSLAKAIGLYHTQGMPVDTWAVNEGRLSEKQLLDQVEEVFRERKAILGYELKKFKKGVFFCYFGEADIIQHMFWGERQRISEWYRRFDSLLGEVMDGLNSEDTLLVLSDHGFVPFTRTVHLNSWLRANGYLVLKNPGADSGRGLLADIDWPKTKAYAIGFGGIFINQKGRELSGAVEPGKEAEVLKEEIAVKLSGWSDEANGEPVINRVYRRQDIFSGRYAAEGPDLYAGFNKGFRASWQTAVGGVPECLIEDNTKKWSGDHLVDPVFVPGIIFSNRKIDRKEPSIYDIAPTILKLIGYKEEELEGLDFDGRPLM